MVKMPTLEPPVKNRRRRGMARFCGGLVRWEILMEDGVGSFG